MARVFYFGARSRDHPGHHLFQGEWWLNGGDRDLPFAYCILDASLLAPDYQRGPQVEGIIRRVVIAGWTVLTFWDRSADPRSASNSAFVVEGDVDIGSALAAARRVFPSVFARFTFELVPEGDR